MSDTPPVVGQTPWGEDLNAYLAELEARIVALEANPEHVYNSYAWKFAIAAPPAGVGELRLNNTDPSLATLIDMRLIDSDGADRTPVFLQVTPGDTIRVNAWSNASIYHRFHASGVPTLGTTNVTIPVVWEAGTGTLPTAGQAKINVGFLVSLIL